MAAFPARIAAFASLLLAISLTGSAAEKYDLVGKPAPDLVARGLTGENVRISEHRGEVVVVSFWSGGCNTCRAQLTALDRIAKTYASAGLTVIGVNLDDNVARARKFARAQDVKFPLLISPIGRSVGFFLRFGFDGFFDFVIYLPRFIRAARSAQAIA